MLLLLQQLNTVSLSEVAPQPRAGQTAMTFPSQQHQQQQQPQDSRWISSLRRRDPELQPTLPSINSNPNSNSNSSGQSQSHHSSASNVGIAATAGNTASNVGLRLGRPGRASALTAAVRKSRSVERLRARKLSTNTQLTLKQRPIKKNSLDENSNSDDQDATTSIEDNSHTQSTTMHNTPRCSPKIKVKHFSPVGFEGHLVDTLEKDILQRHPCIKWTDVAGLNDAKTILQVSYANGVL